MTKEYTKDYSLLRPATIEYVKAGGKVCWYDGDTSELECFITNSGSIVVYSQNLTEVQTEKWLSSYVRMKPICWIEGKPVYKGDVLYFKADGSKHTVNDFTGTFFICDEGFNTWSIHIDYATWTKPVTKKTYWVNLYFDNNEVLAYKHETRESADECDICGVRVACVPVEIEE